MSPYGWSLWARISEAACDFGGRSVSRDGVPSDSPKPVVPMGCLQILIDLGHSGRATVKESCHGSFLEALVIISFNFTLWLCMKIVFEAKWTISLIQATLEMLSGLVGKVRGSTLERPSF